MAKDHKARVDKLKIEINAEKVRLIKLRDESLKSETKSKNDKMTN